MELGLPEVVALVTMVALNAYVLTGGADFGGGIWISARPDHVPRRNDT